MKYATRLLICCSVLGLACARQPAAQRIPMPVRGSGSVEEVVPNVLTPQEQRAGWRLLFDGATFTGWRGLGYDSVPTAHWKIENGAIRKIADGDVPRLPDGQPAAGGDLMTIDTFRDFELSFDWKISRAGNSGVKYNVSEELSMAYAPN